jgi:hypothetical protein
MLSSTNRRFQLATGGTKFGAGIGSVAVPSQALAQELSVTVPEVLC